MQSAEFIGHWHNASLRHLAIERFRGHVNRVAEFLTKQGVIDGVNNEKILSTFERSGIIEWFALHPQFAQPYPETDESAFLEAAARSVDLLITPQYSKEFRIAVTNIIESVPTISSFQDFLTNAETEFRAVEDPGDAESVQLVLSIFRHSKDHWEDTGVQKLKPGTWVIIADGIGGLIGSSGGPGGAIVLGAAVSALTNEYYN